MLTKFKGTFAMFYKYRFLLQNLIQRDIKVKYRRSTLGILWSVLNPLLMMLVMTLVFSHFFRFDSAKNIFYLGISLPHPKVYYSMQCTCN